MNRDMEDRLDQAAEQINAETQPLILRPGQPLTGDNNEPPPFDVLVPQPPEIANLVLSGIWVAYTGPDGSLLFQEESSGNAVNSENQENPALKAGEPRLDASSAGIFPLDLFEQVETSQTLLEGKKVFQNIQSDDIHARVLVYPIIRGNASAGGVSQIIGSIIVGSPIDQQQATMNLVNRILLLVGLGGVCLAALGGWLLAGRALSPVQKITGTAQEITRQANSSESLAIRLDVPDTGDELSLLASTFNTMLSRIEDSFNAQRRFVADASHELRTPLTAIRGNVDVLLRQARSDRPVSNEMLTEALTDVHHESGRMARLIADLLTLARSDARSLSESVQHQVVSLEVLAAEAYRTLEPLANGRFLVFRAETPVAISGDGDRLVQVMIILGENAIRHTPEGGTITIAVDQVPATDDDPACARVTVSDTGEGIARENLPHLFDRFYRVEGSRDRGNGGTGLGLSIALGIVRNHHGWIDVETAPGQGSSFTVYLPL
jgi:signal transduction histidine kinase